MLSRSIPILVCLALTAGACADSENGATEDAATADMTTEPTTATTATTDDAGRQPATTEASTPPTTGPATTPATTAAASASAEVELTVTPAEHSTLAAEIAVTSGQPVQFSIHAESTDGHSVTTPITADSTTSATLPLVGLRGDREYDIEVTAHGENGTPVGQARATFTSGPVPDFIPEFELELDADLVAPGVRIIEVMPFGAPDLPMAHSFGVDEDGEVVWYFQYTSTVAGLTPTSTGTLLGHQYPVGGLELDVLGNVLGRWHTNPPDPDAPPPEFDEDIADAIAALEGRPGDPTPIAIDIDGESLGTVHHEFMEMPGGTLLVLSTRNHELTDEQREQFCPGDDQPFHVVSDIAVEMERDGTVLRSWDIWDVIDVEETPGVAMCSVTGPYASDLGRDWAHANGLSYDPERDLIVMSARHTDQLVAFDHLDDLGAQSDLAWVMGTDGTLAIDGDQTYHQHAPEFQDDGSLLVYDNGNDRPGTTYLDPDNPMYSRAVLYDLDLEGDDPAAWGATQVWEHLVEDDMHGTPLYAYFVGDADLLPNGNVLIDHGGIGDGSEVQRARVIEVVPADGEDGGEIVFDLRMGTPEYPTASYRSVHLESLYFGEHWQTD